MICQICGQLTEDCEMTEICVEANGGSDLTSNRDDSDDWFIDPDTEDQ